MATLRSLDVTIISAKGLNKVNLVGKMDVYAVVYINNTITGNQDQKQKTHVDKDGDSSPTWNYSMSFKFDESAALQNRLTLVVKIKTEGMFGDKDLGEVHVPVKELLDGVTNNGKPLQFVSYQVRKPSGKPKGELSFSYKLAERPAPVGKLDDQPVTAYPAGNPAGIGNNSIPTGKVDQPDKPNGKADEPVTAYPAVGPSGSGGPGSLYPPVYAAAPPVVTGAASVAGPYPPATGGVYYPPPAGYPQPPPQSGYAYQQPQPGYGGYPPYPPPGYGGYPPPQPGYGYPPVQQPQQAQKKGKFGMGLGAGLLGGALGGLLIGDIVSDASGGCGGDF
uniref:protein SRC2 n=1 Tax=Erigeron canadensis TaxID=72917 RepID=UPI001CB9BFC1|nr:protein SRC2 [Erigeron canadensis]